MYLCLLKAGPVELFAEKGKERLEIRPEIDKSRASGKFRVPVPFTSTISLHKNIIITP
jgi:hypothetical protein